MTTTRYALVKHSGTGTVHHGELSEVDGRVVSIFTRCDYRAPNRRVREVKGGAEVTCKRCAAIAEGTIYGRNN